MTTIKILAVTTFFVLWQNSRGQGFVNLGFENATITPPTASVAGWTAYISPSISNPTNQVSAVYYNTFALSGGGIFLEDTNAPFGGAGPGGYSILPIQGKYSVFLQGASVPAALTVASIGQIGTIPITAQSLTFIGFMGSPCQITFNGQPLNYLQTSSTANYNIYAADISAHAGQTGQLLFTAPLQSSALLDNLQFSNQPVPEPNSLGMFGVGALLLGVRRRNFSRRRFFRSS